MSALTDAAGQVTRRYAYDAYGKRVVMDGAGNAVTADARDAYGFTGRRYDSVTGLWYFRNRMYSGELGRFVSRDPLGYVDGFSFYGGYFVPGKLDPSGLVSWYTTDIVVKSFINGVGRLGTLGNRPSAFPGAMDPPWLLATLMPELPNKDLLGLSADERMAIFAEIISNIQAFNQTQPFNQNPQDDSKDGEYRLYTRTKVRFCCDGDNLTHMAVLLKDMDGGNELRVRVPFHPLMPLARLITVSIDGTINRANERFVRTGPSSAEVSWTGYGRPNKLVEPGMQWVGMRTSKNIWHSINVELSCDGGKGLHRQASFIGSQFPSHASWINGQQVMTIPQGDFSDLWTAHPNFPDFVK